MLNTNKQSESLLSSRLKNQDSPSTSSPVKSIKIDCSQDDEQSVVTIPTYKKEAAEAEKKKDKKEKGLSKKRKLISKPKKLQLPQAPPKEEGEPLSAADYDEMIDFEAYQETIKIEKTERTIARISKLILVVMVLLCIYIAFLIYGLLSTNYVYKENGLVGPEILTVEDLHTLSEYKEMSGYYIRTKNLYEKILQLDYQLTQNAENQLSLAMEYTRLLKDVSKLATDIKASQLDIGYSSIISQMYELVYTHIAIYLQNISDAIINDDSYKANQAIQGRKVVTDYFASLTSNMYTLYQNTKGANNGDMFTQNITPH